MTARHARRSFPPGIAEALLDWLGAPAGERAGMLQDARVDLASARLEEVVIREFLEQLPPEQLSPKMRDDLAAAQIRVVESVRVLLAMRAATPTIGFPV